jgi:hypothetical protein
MFIKTLLLFPKVTSDISNFIARHCFLIYKQLKNKLQALPSMSMCRFSDDFMTWILRGEVSFPSPHEELPRAHIFMKWRIPHQPHHSGVELY